MHHASSEVVGPKLKEPDSLELELSCYDTQGRNSADDSCSDLIFKWELHWLDTPAQDLKNLYPESEEEFFDKHLILTQLGSFETHWENQDDALSTLVIKMDSFAVDMAQSGLLKIRGENNNASNVHDIVFDLVRDDSGKIVFVAR